MNQIVIKSTIFSYVINSTGNFVLFYKMKEKKMKRKNGINLQTREKLKNQKQSKKCRPFGPSVQSHTNLKKIKIK